MYRINPAMTSVLAFLTLVDAYCFATKMAEATLASRLFNDGKRIGQVRAGADIGARRLERAMQWLSDNWPENADWPEDVARPITAKAFDELFIGGENDTPEAAE